MAVPATTALTGAERRGRRAGGARRRAEPPRELGHALKALGPSAPAIGHAPRQNRVDPMGEIVSDPARGALMGNRGGRLHDEEGALTRRRWASKAWIACRTAFKDRRRSVMGAGYTELFFLDEATALAAGHRPCFECRRADALAFAAAWAAAHNLAAPPKAPEMDAALHVERLAPAPNGRRKQKRLWRAELADLPAGAMIRLWGELWLVEEGWLWRWRFSGYDHALERSGLERTLGAVEVATPPSMVAALAAGYRARHAAPIGGAD